MSTDWERQADRWRGPAERYAWGLLGNAWDAEDVVQDVAMELLERERRGAPVSEGLWWTALRARVYDRLRRRRRSPTLVSWSELPDRESGTDWEQYGEAGAVLRALETLSAPARELLLLHYDLDWSLQAIAAHVGASESAVKARLWRARRALAKRLRPHGGPD